MRRAKSTPLVTGQLYRNTGGVMLVLAFLVAMLSTDGDDRAGTEIASPPLAARVDAAPHARAGGHHTAHAYFANDGGALADGPRDPGSAAAWSERSSPLAYLGAGDQGDPDHSETTLNLAPPPGYARDPHADRPTPQQLERLIAQSYVRSGSDGGGD